MRCQISSYGWDVLLRRMSNEIHQLRVSKHEAISYLWYIKNSTCALSMHGQALGAMNCFNCVDWLWYNRSCSYWVYQLSNNISDQLWQSLEGKGARINTFIGRLERSLCKGIEIVTCHSTLQSRHQMWHRYLWSVVAQWNRSILSGVEARLLVFFAVCDQLRTL
jgi:hypothetical protein